VINIDNKQDDKFYREKIYKELNFYLNDRSTRDKVELVIIF
jgi:hypothetical protein